METPAEQEVKTDPKLDRSRDLSKLTKHSYLAGFAGTVTVLGMGYLAAKKKALAHGWGILKNAAEQADGHETHLTMAFVLLVCSITMFAVELGIRLDVDRGKLLSIAPAVKDASKRAAFFGECVLVYIVELATLSLAFGAYEVLNEYGYQSQHGAGYYQPWFVVMPVFFWIYAIGGLPYVLFTRALQHDPRADRKQAAFVIMKALRRLRARIAKTSADDIPPFDRYDRSSINGLAVKFFFVPLMTVFFVDQFTHLVNNWEYVLGHPQNVTIRDVHNVSYTVVFSVDVGLAWCGYVVSSRWIKNTLFSVEPTMLGWVVALLSYPPINGTFGRYFSTPGESSFFQIESPRAVVVLAIASILSFSVYTSATVVFGLRFSNLTHRGIITTGPYSIVRHPAYAAKNFSWWCVMLPYPIYQIVTTHTYTPLLQVLGLMAMSFIYFLRAITEERHLERDPEYRAYMKKVPYRFIPRVF